MSLRPFHASSPAIAVNATTSPSASAALPGKGSVLRVCNEGGDNAFISVTSTGANGSAPAATNAALPTGTPSVVSCPVMAGEDAVFSIDNNAIQNFSVISRGTSTLVLQVGEGQ